MGRGTWIFYSAALRVLWLEPHLKSHRVEPTASLQCSALEGRNKRQR